MTVPEYPMCIGGRELRTASPIEVRPTCGQAPLAVVTDCAVLVNTSPLRLGLPEDDVSAARVLVGPNEKVPSDRITPGRTPSLLQKEQ